MNELIFPTVLVLILVNVAINVKLTNSLRPSGFYSDNELDQTEMDWQMTDEEKRDMEMELLNLLGMPYRPKKINESHIKKAAPRFMLDVYKSLMEKENDENYRAKRTADTLDLNLSEKNAIDESDVIMTIESVDHHLNEVRHERGKRLWFNVSDVPIAENIVGAELRLYKSENHRRKKADAVYVITVYQLIDTDDGERELEYVSAINTSAAFTGWLDLNLTHCLSNWVAFPDSNKGLYLSVHQEDGTGHEIRPEDIGLITSRSEDETHPFMVAFLKVTNHVKARRSTRELKRRVKKSNYATVMKNAAQDSSPYETPRSCKIRTLYISFKDINWKDWIIAPDGYAAYYCSGECNFPLNAHMNATNHAIVQTLVHLMTPLRYPKPCCAPTKLTPVSVLYFLDDTNVILKKFKKMVVKSCGCH
ncbi:hypothetical protein WA026_008147 [Henosepilachna vigintioctopunctata]|uniref:TGF-beta family profile domain-containing protein n=1 Tax=Henosepilachna vigintioctopunctata TaxID=420089 RepID=A0AAW1TTU6_9CUCU|nr:glass bottom boat [Henosepilachna vigintioctopunctata]